MSFDPYHKWLGIPQGQRPPDHYALLGIPLFEGDDEVISYAADRQMLHLRSLAHGPNGNLSQRLLNEISLAKCCLLDPTERAEYDAQLKQLLEARAPSQAEQTPESSRLVASRSVTDRFSDREALEPPDAATVDLTIAPRITTVRRNRPRRSRIGRWIPWLLPFLAAGALAVFVWYAKHEFARRDAERTDPPQTVPERAVDQRLDELPRNRLQPRNTEAPRGFAPTRSFLPGNSDPSGRGRTEPDPKTPDTARAGGE